jgi:non-specific serine/threonine protein kinase
VRLFVERAAFTQPGFHITHHNAPALVKVCQRLDGIPLAIELAAARTKVLTVEQIASKLDDQFRLLTGGSRMALPRQQTLRATMDWSYELLFDEERTLLRRLSVFAGGWTLEAAEAVCSRGGVEAIMEILDLLLQLVDKSLVVVDTQGQEARYRLLETVRQYGWERLSEVGEADDLRKRHRDWYLELAERAAPELRGPHQVEWLERLEIEHDNLRAALEWSRTAQDGAPALVRFAGTLSWFWYVRGHWSEGRDWAEAALSYDRGTSPPSARARAMLAAGIFAWRQGDNARAKALLTDLQPLCRAIGDDWGLAHSITTLGYAAVTDGEYERAIALGNEGLALWREVGAKWGIALSLSLLGHVAIHQEDFPHAAKSLTESLALRRASGDKWGIASALQRLGFVMERCGDYVQAAALFKESLAHEEALGDKRVIAECLIGLAEAAYAQGQLTRAAVLFAAAEALREILGASLPHFDRTGYDRDVEAIGARVGDSVFRSALAKGRALTLEQVIQYALEEEKR